MHLGLFRYYLKLGAKRAEYVQLMQKFVQRSRVGILHNIHTRSTKLDPKLMFLCVLFCLGAFGTISLLHKTLCKTGRIGAINAKIRAMKSRRKFSQQMQLIHIIRS